MHKIGNSKTIEINKEEENFNKKIEINIHKDLDEDKNNIKQNLNFDNKDE